MARDGDSAGMETGRREPAADAREHAPEPLVFGPLHGRLLNQWKVEERRG